MKISLITSAGTLVLCDGSDRTVGKACGPASLSYSAPVQIQTGQFLRSHNSKPFYRGNGLEQIGFEVNRLFASFEEAFAWLKGHRLVLRETDWTKTATAEFLLDAPVSTTTVLSDAVVSIAGAALVGCSLKITYQMVGSKLT